MKKGFVVFLLSFLFNAGVVLPMGINEVFLLSSRGEIFFESGWEDGQDPGLSNHLIYFKDVTNPHCSRQALKNSYNGSYGLMISGESRASDAYCYHKVFDLNLPVVKGMKIGYWIYHVEGTGKIAVDGRFTDGDTLRDFGGQLLKDQKGIPIHPAHRQDPMEEWVYVEVDLSAAAGKTLDAILFAFDNGNDGFKGFYLAYVDDLKIFTEDIPVRSILPTSAPAASTAAPSIPATSLLPTPPLPTSPLSSDSAPEAKPVSTLAPSADSTGLTSSVLFTSGWESGENAGYSDRFADLGGGAPNPLNVFVAPGDSYDPNNPICRSVFTWNPALRGMYVLRVAGLSRPTPQNQRAWAYHRVFDVNIPIYPGTKIGYWIYYPFSASDGGTVKISVDGMLYDYQGSYQSIPMRQFKDASGQPLKDQRGVPIHPKDRRWYKDNHYLKQWHYVEVDLTPAAGKLLTYIMFAFDNGGDGYSGPYEALIDDFKIFRSDSSGATVDLLPFFCPNCLTKTNDQIRNHVASTSGNGCFYTHYRPNVRGREGFNIVKNCDDPTQFEVFNYDQSFIYHYADTTKYNSPTDPWTSARYSNDRRVYFTYLNGPFGTPANSSCEGPNGLQYWISAGYEGAPWIPRTVRVGASFGRGVTVVGLGREGSQKCACVSVNIPMDNPYVPDSTLPFRPGSHGRTIKLVSLETTNLDDGFNNLGSKEVIRIAIMDGPGKGRNYWFARDYGLIGFGYVHPPDPPDAPKSLRSPDIQYIRSRSSGAEEFYWSCNPLPDLTIVSLNGNPQSGTVDVQVKNQGAASTGNTHVVVKYYAQSSTDPDQWTEIGMRTGNPMAAGETQNFSLPITGGTLAAGATRVSLLTASLSSGTQQIKAVVDPDRLIPEESRENNSASGSVQILWGNESYFYNDPLNIPTTPADDSWYSSDRDHRNDIALVVDPSNGVKAQAVRDHLGRGGRVVLLVCGLGNWGGGPSGWERPITTYINDYLNAIVLRVNYTNFSRIDPNVYASSFKKGVDNVFQMVQKAHLAGSQKIRIYGHSEGSDVTARVVAIMVSDWGMNVHQRGPFSWWTGQGNPDWFEGGFGFGNPADQCVYLPPPIATEVCLHSAAAPPRGADGTRKGIYRYAWKYREPRTGEEFFYKDKLVLFNRASDFAPNGTFIMDAIRIGTSNHDYRGVFSNPEFMARFEKALNPAQTPANTFGGPYGARGAYVDRDAGSEYDFTNYHYVPYIPSRSEMTRSILRISNHPPNGIFTTAERANVKVEFYTREGIKSDPIYLGLGENASYDLLGPLPDTGGSAVISSNEQVSVAVEYRFDDGSRYFSAAYPSESYPSKTLYFPILLKGRDLRNPSFLQTTEMVLFNPNSQEATLEVTYKDNTANCQNFGEARSRHSIPAGGSISIPSSEIPSSPFCFQGVIVSGVVRSNVPLAGMVRNRIGEDDFAMGFLRFQYHEGNYRAFSTRGASKIYAPLVFVDQEVETILFVQNTSNERVEFVVHYYTQNGRVAGSSYSYIIDPLRIWAIYPRQHGLQNGFVGSARIQVTSPATGKLALVVQIASSDGTEMHEGIPDGIYTYQKKNDIAQIPLIRRQGAEWDSWINVIDLGNTDENIRIKFYPLYPRNEDDFTPSVNKRTSADYPLTFSGSDIPATIEGGGVVESNQGGSQKRLGAAVQIKRLDRREAAYHDSILGYSAWW